MKSPVTKCALWTLGSGAALFLLSSLAGSVYLQNSFLRPKRKQNLTSDLTGFVPEAVYSTTTIRMTSRDGLGISALLLTPESINGHGIVVCHGLAHDSNSGIRFVQYLLNAGYTLLLIDFRNHGQSDGDITTYGYYEKHDLHAGIRCLREHLGKIARIGVLGASMGASIALLTAAETREVKAMVLDSPFSSLKKISTEWAEQITRLPYFLLAVSIRLAYVWVFIVAGCRVRAVEPWRKAQEVDCPLFIIHGGADKLIPADHSREIYRHAAGEKELWILEEADHLGVYVTNAPEYQRRVLAFFRKNLLEAAQSASITEP